MARLLRYFLEQQEKKAPATGAGAMEAGVWSGSFYPHVRRLEDVGWVYAEWEIVPDGADRPRRRFYYLTVDGARFARAAVDEYDQRPRVWRRRRR
jgi:DNA-binding PadR family transcriptional regulator